MQQAPHYDDVVGEVANFSASVWQRRGGRHRALNRIVVDPGFGFGKTPGAQYRLLRRLGELTVPGLPLLVGMSRKSMLGLITGRPARSGFMPASPRHCWRCCAARASCACMMWRQRAMRWQVGRDRTREWRTTDGRKYFGTDGVRGGSGQSPITPDFVMRLGYAAGKVTLVAREACRPANARRC
jgi:hypothetical protein